MTISAQDGTEALDCMKNNDSIHLVLTDINMPQMDGWELALHIKELKPDIPIVVLTGEAPDAITNTRHWNNPAVFSFYHWSLPIKSNMALPATDLATLWKNEKEV